MRPQSKGTGSGFIVSGKRLLTNAHVVAYQTSVQVRRHGDALKYTARVLAVAHECDLAVLTVEDDAFWADARALDFGALPQLQESVFVAGYPVGGENISVTSGVVSRIDFDSYAHSTRSHLVCSVDAAINPGNSGGPAFMMAHGGSGAGARLVVAGVAFQSLQGAEATGYIIPASVCQRVLDDLSRHGRLTGFARLGFVFQPVESPHMKAFLRLPRDATGVLVNSVLPLSNLHGALKKHDLVTAVDGHAVADDGTVALRGEDRIDVGYCVSTKFIGEPVTLSIWRDGAQLTVRATVEDVPDLVPPTLYDRKPQYLVHAGLVFTPATEPFLEASFGGLDGGGAPMRLMFLAAEGEQERPGQQVLVLASILTHPVNVGYEDDAYVGAVLRRVNGAEVNDMAALAAALASATGHWLQFEFEDDVSLVVPREEAAAATPLVLAQHSIPAAMSADLLPAAAAAAAPAPTATSDAASAGTLGGAGAAPVPAAVVVEASTPTSASAAPPASEAGASDGGAVAAGGHHKQRRSSAAAGGGGGTKTHILVE